MAESLLGGRNTATLSERETTRVYNTFLGMDEELARAAVKFAADAATHFRVVEEEGGERGEIVVGPDIYPGQNIVNPNSSLSLKAAVAHELTHFHRWQDKTELADAGLRNLDEAITSLEALLRYEKYLNEHDIRQLVADAIQRLQLFVGAQGNQAS